MTNIRIIGAQSANMIEKIKEWQSFISLGVFLVTCTAAVVAYKGKVDSNEEHLDSIMVKLERIETDVSDKFDKIEAQVDGNKEWLTQVHLLVIEVKGDIKALRK